MDKEFLNSLSEYFKQLDQLTREIKREDMAALWKQVRKGDKAAKNKIMELNLRLVVPTAKRFQRSHLDLMDLIEEGNLGLMQAIEKFDASKGYRFSTYAIYWIEQFIRKYIEEQSGSIKIPSHAWGNLKRWFKVWNTLKEENGRDPSLAEMAAELSLSERQVKAIMDTLSAATGVDSLTMSVGDENEITLEEVLSDDGKGNPHDVFVRSENVTVLQQSLLELSERDREIVTLRFGLIDNEPKTLGEVADKMGLSRERVRQIEERAVQQMRKAAYKAGLLDGEWMPAKSGKLKTGLSKKGQAVLGTVTDNGPLVRLLRRNQTAGKRISQKSRKSTPKEKAASAAKKSVKKSKNPRKKSARK